MDDQIANLIALGKGIEESRPDNAEELLALVHKMLCAHRSQYEVIEKFGKEFLAPSYDGYGDETNKQRHSRMAEIAAGTVSPNFTLHLFARLEDAGLAMIRPLADLAQTRKPKEMVLPDVEEQVIENGKLVTYQQPNPLKMPPKQLIENADLLHNEGRQGGGRSRGEGMQKEAAARMAKAQQIWDSLAAAGMPERYRGGAVAERMGVSPQAVGRWRRSNWGKN
tara:strand:+ start:668 stop:1336 length:669 start_codon:yes stop_codon:yes gene_type:complete